MMSESRPEGRGLERRREERVAGKRWRLVVTELGETTPLHDVAIEATNWMAALRAGRETVGEPGGVPAGASCAVAPDGRVTILDPAQRRRYVLTPGFEGPLSSPPPSAEPRPGSAVGAGIGGGVAGPSAGNQPPASPASAGPGSTSPATAGPAPSGAPPRRTRKQTVAYVPPVPAAPPAEPPRKKRVPAKTIAYIAPEDLAQLKEVVVGPSSATPRPSPTVAEKPPAQGARAGSGTGSSVESSTGSSTGSTPATTEPSAPVAQAAPTAPTDATVPRPSQGAPSSQGSPASRAEPAAVSTPGTAEAVALVLLFERDEEPSEDNPLHYRERIYVIDPGVSPEQAEEMARGVLAEIQGALSAASAGKFVNIALFDHEWQEAPARPPVVTVQWKDWRNQVDIAHPMRDDQMRDDEPRDDESRAVPASPGSPDASSAAAQSTSGAGQPATSASQAAAVASSGVPAATPAGGNPSRGRRITGDQDRRLAQAFEACQDLFFLQTPAEALEFVARLFSELIPSEAVSACLYDINRDELRFVSALGTGGDARQGHAVGSRTGLFGVSARQDGGTLRVPDVPADARFDASADGRPGMTPRSALYQPVAHQGRLLAVIQLLNSQKGPTYTTEDAYVSSYVGGQLAQFLYRARIAPDRKPAF